MLESASKLLTRNEEASFIAGASVSADPSLVMEPTRRRSVASAWRTSDEGNLHGYFKQRSEIRLKSQHSFTTALQIGEFLELVSIV